MDCEPDGRSLKKRVVSLNRPPRPLMASDQQTPRARGSRAPAARRRRRHARSAHPQRRLLAPVPLRRWLRDDAPWIAILCLTSGFQFFRGAPADGAVFVAAALALALDSLGLLRFLGSARFPRAAVGYTIGAAIVVVIAALPRFSIAAGVIVAGVGLAVIPFAWSDPARHSAPRRPQGSREAGSPPRAIRRAAILWSGLAVALCLWEMTAFFLGMPSAAAQYAHPALSDVIMPLLGNPLSLGAGTALWLLGGAALLRRGRPR